MSALNDFLDRLYPVAKQVQKEIGLNAVLGMGEAAHESNYGLSKLSDPSAILAVITDDSKGAAGIQQRAANNLFGFTAEPGTYWRTQKLPYVLMPTNEWRPKKDGNGNVLKDSKGNPISETYKTTRPFRAYASWEESYRDWARLMQTDRYNKAGALDALKTGNTIAFADALNKAGYATDPFYGSKVEKHVKNIQAALA